MSKKKTLILLILFMAVVFCAKEVSKTYAKYISSIDESDSARVAIWDVDFGVNEQEVDLFQESYGNYVQSLNCDASGKCDKVVAPGTSGSYSFQVHVDAETNYKIMIDIEEMSNTIDQLKFYYDDIEDPIPISVLPDVLTYAFQNNKVYAAATETNLKRHTIRWEWPYEVGNTQAAIDANDIVDTRYGNQAISDSSNAGYETQAHAKIKFKITVVQTEDAAT